MNALNIHTERAVIEIISHPAKLTIQNNKPTFNVKHEMPEMHIERKMPEFSVDWSAVHASSGKLSPVKKTKEDALNAKRHTLESTAAIVERGDMLKNANNPTAIAQAAVSVTVKDMPEINIGLMPEEKAHIEWDPGYCSIEWTSPVLRLEWDDSFMPTIECEPHAIEVRLKNRPLVQIRVNVDNIPNPIGTRVTHDI